MKQHACLLPLDLQHLRKTYHRQLQQEQQLAEQPFT